MQRLDIKKNIGLYADLTRQEIVNQSLQLQGVIQEIRTCEGPQEALDTLNAEVRSKIAALRKNLEDLENLSKEQDLERDRLQLLEEAKSHRQMLSSSLSAFRNASVACQQKIDSSNKYQLFDEDKETVNKRRRNKDKQSLVSTSAGITDHLLSISRHLAETQQRSADTLETLANSSSTLHGTQDEFKNMGGVINQSGKLLAKYGRRELTDKVLVFFAFAFFMACVLYIMKKRLF